MEDSHTEENIFVKADSVECSEWTKPSPEPSSTHSVRLQANWEITGVI